MMSKLPLCLLLILSSVVSYTQPSAQGGLTITNGGNLVVNGAANIVVNDGGFSNAGAFNAGSGTVTFTGTSVANITGTSPTSFYNFLIDKSSRIGLLRNIDVINSLTLGNGIIDLNGFDINLGTTGNIIGERPASRVIGPAGGFLIRSVLLTAPVKVNPGNIGVEITTTSNPGLTVIKRGHQPLQLSGGGIGIQRFFDVSAANNTGANSTLRFYYFDEELGSVAENELTVYSLTSSVPGEKLGMPDGSDPVANYVQVSNMELTARFIPASVDPGGGYANRIIQVFPNPTPGPVNIRFRSARNQRVILQVVDNTGKVVAHKELYAATGYNTVSYDLGNIVQGVYYLRVLNIEKKAFKILKQ